MSAAAPTVAGRHRRSGKTVVSRRAAGALVILLIAALAGGGVVLAQGIRQRQEDTVDAHLGVALQAALSEVARDAAQAQQQAAALAGDRALQRALASRDRHALARIVAEVPGAAAVPGTTRPSAPTQPALQRQVRVLTDGTQLGTVSVSVPLDGSMLARLRSIAPLASGEGFLFVRGDRVLAGPPQLAGARLSPDATSVQLAGGSYRALQARLLGGSGGVRLAALAPASEVDGPVAHADRLLAACLAATLAALLLLARLLARPVLVPLTRLADEAESSTVDELTHLPNRRAFAGAAAVELARSRRSGRPLAVAVVDVDGFKQVNDTFGHTAGDTVLRGVADELRARFRDIDFPARYGGEEFAVLLPETDSEGARQAVERFLVALEGREFGDGRALPDRITASAGVASGVTTEFDALLEAADGALYRAKRNGKNQVQVAAAAAPAD